MHSVFVVGFYSDQHKQERGFEAEYTFVDGCEYGCFAPALGRHFGTARSVCLSVRLFHGAAAYAIGMLAACMPAT